MAQVRLPIIDRQRGRITVVVSWMNLLRAIAVNPVLNVTDDSLVLHMARPSSMPQKDLYANILAKKSRRKMGACPHIHLMEWVARVFDMHTHDARLKPRMTVTTPKNCIRHPRVQVLTTALAVTDLQEPLLLSQDMNIIAPKGKPLPHLIAGRLAWE